jgi:hypothetical protein
MTAVVVSANEVRGERRWARFGEGIGMSAELSMYGALRKWEITEGLSSLGVLGHRNGQSTIAAWDGTPDGRRPL